MAITRRYDDGLEMRVIDRGVRWQMTLMWDGEAVSGLGLVKKRIRIGDAVVKMGGIAGVWTADKHRKKGYASRVIWESVELMKQKGYETSILFGIRDFYHRYGFVEAFPESSIELAADRLGSDGKLQTRLARKADLPAMAKLYNRHNGGRTATVVRKNDWAPAWRLPGFGPGAIRRPGKSLLACDGGRIRGYAVYDIQLGRCRVSEIVGVDAAAYSTLASSLARRARRGSIERIGFMVPTADPFIQFSQRYGGLFRTRYAGDGGSMARMIDLEALMRRLTDELWRRWNRSDVPWRRPLALVTDIGSVVLVPGRGSVEVKSGGHKGAARVVLSQEALTLLVMGTRSVESVATAEDVRIPNSLLPLLNALFPTGDAYVWWPDRF